MSARKLTKNSWYVSFSFQGQRIRKKSPENTKVGAETYETLLRQKLARGEQIDFDETQAASQKQKFKDFAWKWFETYVKTNNKPSEISRKKYTLQTNLLPFFSETPLNRISTMQVEEYKSKKKNQGLGPKTINNHLSVLSSCLHTAQDWLGLEKLPRVKKLPAPPETFDFLTYEESHSLLSHAAGVWHDIILMALNTGMRIGEIRGLRWVDIDWNNRMITVRHSWCDYKKALLSPKSNKERHIPLNNDVYTMLSRQKFASGFVFADKKGDRVDAQRLNKEIGKACMRAGLRVISCHTLRHTFASHLVMKGAPLKSIQELLGHSHIQTTMRYAHMAPASLREAVGLLENDRQPNSLGQYTVNGGQVSRGVY